MRAKCIFDHPFISSRFRFSEETVGEADAKVTAHELFEKDKASIRPQGHVSNTELRIRRLIEEPFRSKEDIDKGQGAGTAS